MKNTKHWTTFLNVGVVETFMPRAKLHRANLIILRCHNEVAIYIANNQSSMRE